MRFLGTIFIFLLVLSGSFSSWPQASARTLSASGKITIRAVVLPAQYVIVDSSGSILRIESNTQKDVTPQVYLNEVKKGNERPLTPLIQAQYRQMVPVGASQVGILYKKTVPLAEGGATLPSLLSPSLP